MRIVDVQKTLAITLGVFLGIIFVSLKAVASAGLWYLLGTPYGAVFILGILLLFIALFRTLYYLEMDLKQYRTTLWIALAGIALPTLAFIIPAMMLK
nr:putative integron gene cassette protein [uncultured bacterium]